jgi:hypothetical protein
MQLAENDNALATSQIWIKQATTFAYIEHIAGWYKKFTLLRMAQ